MTYVTLSLCIRREQPLQFVSLSIGPYFRMRLHLTSVAPGASPQELPAVVLRGRDSASVEPADLHLPGGLQGPQLPRVGHAVQPLRVLLHQRWARPRGSVRTPSLWFNVHENGLRNTAL